MTQSALSPGVEVVEPPSPQLVPPPPPPAAVDRSSRVSRSSPDLPASSTSIAVARVALAVTAVGLLAALFFAYEFLLSGIPVQRMQAELLAEFKQAVPTTTLDAPSSTPAEGTAVALLRIPRIGLSTVVVEGSSPSDLKMGPGHLSASPLPGEYGNSVIEGRRLTYDPPFRSIDSLRKGDTITVATGQGSFAYKVAKVEHVSSGKSDVVSNTSSSELTLVTSDPPVIATGRLAVVAKLQGKPLAVPSRPGAPEGAVQLGLSGDPLGLALGLVWLLLLVFAAGVTWRLRSRVPRTVLYLFAAPVLTTLTLLTYANLDSLLPGTM